MGRATNDVLLHGAGAGEVAAGGVGPVHLERIAVAGFLEDLVEWANHDDVRKALPGAPNDRVDFPRLQVLAGPQLGELLPEDLVAAGSAGAMWLRRAPAPAAPVLEHEAQ